MPTRVLAVVIEQKGEHLICQRPAHIPLGGLWEYPRSAILPDDSLIDAARRELAEKLGVEVKKVGKPILAIPDQQWEVVTEFVPAAIEGEPKCVEHAALRWLPIEDLPSLQLAPTDKQFVESMLARG
jgi:8-oxo-dGTP diphosphatase